MYTENYGTILKTMKICFSMEKNLFYYGKNYGTIVNYRKLKFTVVFYR